MLLCIRQITNENRPYSTGNSTQCSVLIEMGRKCKEEETRVSVGLIHCAIQPKLTQPCKVTIL